MHMHPLCMPLPYICTHQSLKKDFVILGIICFLSDKPSKSCPSSALFDLSWMTSFVNAVPLFLIHQVSWVLIHHSAKVLSLFRSVAECLLSKCHLRTPEMIEHPGGSQCAAADDVRKC